MLLTPLLLCLTLALTLGLLFAEAATTTLSDVIVLGPLLGSYPPSNPDLVGGIQYLEGSLSDSSGVSFGNVSLALTIWAHPAGASSVRVTKQKYFTLSEGQISALGTILLPNLVYNATAQSPPVTFKIPIAGGTGKFFGATGVLETTSTNTPNEVSTYVLFVPLLFVHLLFPHPLPPCSDICPPSFFHRAPPGAVHVHLRLADHLSSVNSPLLAPLA